MKGDALVVEDSKPGLQALAEAALDGDRHAFDRLIGLVERDVMKTALYLTRNPSDAEDVAQEVYVRLFRNLDRLSDLAGLRPWLYRVTVNAARDVLRRRRPWAPLTDWLGRQPAAEPVGRSEFHTRLTEALGRLSFRERTAFVLKELEEVPTSDVAGILGCSEPTVRTHLHNARRKLRRHFSDFRSAS